MKNTIYRFFLVVLVAVGFYALNTDSWIQDEGASQIEESVPDHDVNQAENANDNMLSEKSGSLLDTDFLEVDAEESLLSQEETATQNEVVSSEEIEHYDVMDSYEEVNQETEEVIEAQAESEPEFQKQRSSKEIVELLASAVVTKTDGYSEHFGVLDTINVFAEEIADYMSINTAAWYNLWGGNVQSVTFSCKKLMNEGITTLSFDVGGKTGCSGDMYVLIYFDQDLLPTYEFTVNAANEPTTYEIDITQGSSMKIEVNNTAGAENKAVFYNFKEVY